MGKNEGGKSGYLSSFSPITLPPGSNRQKHGAGLIKVGESPAGRTAGQRRVRSGVANVRYPAQVSLDWPRMVS